MLRLALTRSPRRYISKAVRCRFQSSKASDQPPVRQKTDEIPSSPRASSVSNSAVPEFSSDAEHLSENIASKLENAFLKSSNKEVDEDYDSTKNPIKSEELLSLEIMDTLLDGVKPAKLEQKKDEPEEEMNIEGALEPQDALEFDASAVEELTFETTSATPSSSNASKQVTEAEYSASVVHGRSLHEPIYHARTHNIPVANIHFRSHHVPTLDLFTHFASHVASSLGIPISKVAHLPTQRSLWTVPRSPFVHKKAQENFERRVHKRAIKAWDADAEVIDLWVKYLRKHAMGGVGMKVTRWERAPVGVGASRFADVMSQLNRTPGNSEKIKALGDRIVMQELNAPSEQEIVHSKL